MGGLHLGRAMALLILLRHGESVWNAANLFTGWTDVDLSEQGEEEAAAAGRSLARHPIDVIYTSELMRAHRTAIIAIEQRGDGASAVFSDSDDLDESDAGQIQMHRDWRLNERNYGDLQGLNKDETREKYGEEQVHIWRRSFDVPPPGGESLEMTAERTLPCLHERIMPALKAGVNVLVAAHGNSLRSIVMSIEELTPEQVLLLELPTGMPRLYEFDAGELHRVDA